MQVKNDILAIVSQFESMIDREVSTEIFLGLFRSIENSKLFKLI
jgi:hypothetical protein